MNEERIRIYTDKSSPFQEPFPTLLAYCKIIYQVTILGATPLKTNYNFNLDNRSKLSLLIGNNSIRSIFTQLNGSYQFTASSE